jgi:uncharacterized caspase-like protein
LAQKRVALVIGNSAYVNTVKLENPKNDAADVAAALKKLGFNVILGRDLDKAAMDRAIRDFAETLAGTNMALFFYAGHGLQVGGQNYLVPIDAKLGTAAALDFEMVRLDLLHRTMERESSTNIVVLDACRDNPLARNLARALGTRSATIGRGLAAVESGEGTLISFSTQPGNVALDGEGRNSPFAAALVKHIVEPGADLPTILINVRNDVMAATERRQVPWEHSALTARVYFTPPKPTGPTHEQQVELTFWTSVKDSADPAVLATYLKRYPQGDFATIARALVEHYEQQAKVSSAARDEERKRQEEAKRTAEVTRLEAEKRLRTEKPQSGDAKSEELRKALEDARVAKEAARVAEEQRIAAVRAAEEAKKIAEDAIAAKAATGGDATKKALPTIDKPKERSAAGARNPVKESLRYWPDYSIPTGQSVSTTTSDGKSLTCIGGDRYGTPRRCRFN